MNAVIAYLEFYDQDLAWSFLSDSFFFSGGILYVVLSFWDYRVADVKNYHTLDVFAPLVYVLNSVVDLQWAYHAKQRNKKKHDMSLQWSESRVVSISPTVSNLEQMRKHAAHRRTILAALTFGIAAFFGLLAVLLDAPEWEVLSVHVYIVSAVISVTGQRTQPWFAASKDSMWMNPKILEDMGDALFLLGSLVDATLVDFSLEKPLLGILVSFLWLIDACCYLRSDFIMTNQKQESYLDEGHVFV
jgi:hypothetical protein